MGISKKSRLDPRLHDFRKFVYVLWKHLGVGDPTTVQLDAAQFLDTGPDYEVRPQVDRIMLQMQRGEGKSWLTSAKVLHALAKNPDAKVLVVSASASRATAFTSFCRQLIRDVPILRFLEPSADQRASTIAFDVGPCEPAHDPSLRSVGVFGQMAGAHVDLIIADDIEVPNNSDTSQAREKLKERIKEFDAIVNPGGQIIYLGTPQTEDTVYDILPERGYWIRVWPGRFPPYGGADCNAYHLLTDRGRKELAPYILEHMHDRPGQPTDPSRFGELDLQEREASYGRAGFQLQYMLNPRLSDAEKRPLRLMDFTVMDLDIKQAPRKVVWTSQKPVQDIPNVALPGDRLNGPAFVSPEWDPYDGKIMFIDPAGKGKDELAWCVLGGLGGQLFLLSIGGLVGGYGDTELDHLARVSSRFEVNRIIVEANFGQGMFAQLLRPVVNKIRPVVIEEVTSRTRKEKRIIGTLEPVMMQHRVVVDASALKQDYQSAVAHGDSGVTYCFMHQLTRITDAPGTLMHDDRLDAFAGAVSAWGEFMAVDVEEMRRMREDEEAMAILEEDEMDLFGCPLTSPDPNRALRILRPSAPEKPRRLT